MRPVFSDQCCTSESAVHRTAWCGSLGHKSLSQRRSNRPWQVEEKYLGGMPRLQKRTCEILDGVLKVTASSDPLTPFGISRGKEVSFSQLTNMLCKHASCVESWLRECILHSYGGPHWNRDLQLGCDPQKGRILHKSWYRNKHQHPSENTDGSSYVGNSFRFQPGEKVGQALQCLAGAVVQRLTSPKSYASTRADPTWYWPKILKHLSNWNLWASRIPYCLIALFGLRWRRCFFNNSCTGTHRLLTADAHSNINNGSWSINFSSSGYAHITTGAWQGAVACSSDSSSRFSEVLSARRKTWAPIQTWVNQGAKWTFMRATKSIRLTLMMIQCSYLLSKFCQK